MSEFDFDLDHLDFAAAEQNTNAEQARQHEAQLAEMAGMDEGDDCAGGACKI